MKKEYNKINQRIRKTLSQLTFPVAVENIGDNDSLQKDHSMDSILMMEYMVMIEEEFNIEFDLDFDLNILDSIEATVKYLYSRYGDEL